jgi:hypothetical protein
VKPIPVIRITIALLLAFLLPVTVQSQGFIAMSDTTT